MKNILSVALFIFLFMFAPLKGEAGGMDSKTNPQEEKSNLLAKDREIAAASSKHGILQAIYPFLLEDSLLFPLKGHPIYGRSTCAQLMKQEEIKRRVGNLTWEPVGAGVSAAGDLGYTYGHFELPGPPAAGAEKKDPTYYGMIWKKDTRGNWKVAVCQRLVLLENLNRPPLDMKIDPSKRDEKTREVIATEHAFAQYAGEKGIIEAFHLFIADTGIALGQSGPPRTKETYAKALAAVQQQKKSAGGKVTLEWEPIFSHVSVSGDMAYNFGPYKYTGTGADGTVGVGRGYFVTIWEKQPDNTWKFVFDGGNQY